MIPFFNKTGRNKQASRNETMYGGDKLHRRLKKIIGQMHAQDGGGAGNRQLCVLLKWKSVSKQKDHPKLGMVFFAQEIYVGKASSSGFSENP